MDQFQTRDDFPFALGILLEFPLNSSEKTHSIILNMLSLIQQLTYLMYHWEKGLGSLIQMHVIQ